MHLQLPFRGYQMQGLLWLERWQGMQTRTVQNPMIGTALLAGSMAWAQAGGHLGRFHRDWNRIDPAELESSGESANHNPFDTIPGVSTPTGRLKIPILFPMSETQRNDGREPADLRAFSIDWDPMGFALSSVIVRTGRTTVLCSVCQEDGVPRWRRDQGLGWLSAEYRLLPGSTPDRQRRELMKLSGRTQEIQRLIGRSLRAAIDMKALGENTLLIDCDVIQADAGTRTAAITGAWLALQKACERLVAQGRISTNPVINQVAAVSVGLIEGHALLDLDYSEDSRADVDLNVVMNNSGDLLELQGTAEGAPFSRQQLNSLLDLAEPGLKQLMAAQLDALHED